jgi:hypothetical protein
VLLVAAVHAFASCATREQRALIHELELVASALFFAVVLRSEQGQIWRVPSGLKKKDKPQSHDPQIKRSLVSSENGPGEPQHAPTC